MKKLVLREERERVKKRNQIGLVLILTFLLVASTVGFAIQDNLGRQGNNVNGTQNYEKITYNGFEFTNKNGFWVMDNYVFRNSPEQSVNAVINENLKKIQDYEGKKVYVQSENEKAEAEISLNLGQVAENVQKACLEASECALKDSSLPVKTCEDDFIIIKKSESSKVSRTNNCVYIEGSEDDLIKITDEFLFRVLGVK